ncbi:MAG: aminotransferase class I/II-fold pyridoxal phosphate-dependent enzyme [Gammaproteobacteria bacterium]|nr:aminotransferase class I/II-fold pyridoxal phosphate-dependent enzyme [Gammaproteobacteria bacterium]
MKQPSFSSLLNAHIAGLEEYPPIQPLEVLSARLNIAVDALVKLDANENPYGPVPAVTEALAAYPHYHIYPDPQHHELRDALAAFTGVASENILASHGADELLDYLSRIFLSLGDAIVNAPPTFGMYSFDARLQGAEVIDIPRRDNYQVDVQGIEQAVAARGGDGRSRGERGRGGQSQGGPGLVKLVFLSSPNNPSGNWMDDDELSRLLRLPVMVVLDEAYVEFAEHPSRAPWVAEHDNLIVLRTFSKAAGIAGLRLGYGIFPAWLMPALWKYKQPYNVNVAAAVAGIAALQHAGQIAAIVDTLKGERARLYEVLRDCSFLRPVEGSQANFVLCQVQGIPAHGLKLALEKRGVLVRHYAKPGLHNCIRVSVGKPEHTAALARELQHIGLDDIKAT